MVAQQHPLPMDLRTVAVLSWRLLTGKERRKIGLLAIGMAINGLLQTFSLAVLIPFIGLMLDPGVVSPGGRLAKLSRYLGDPPPQQFMVWCALALFSAIVVKNCFDYVYNYYLNRLVASVEQRVSVGLLAQCIHAPYEWFLSQNTGFLINAVMGDVVIWGRSGLKSILALVSAGILLASIFVLLVGIHPVFGCVLILAGGALNMVTLRLLKPFVGRMAALKHKASNQAYRVLNQALSGVKDIKINGREAFFLKQFSDWQKQYVTTAANLTTSQPVSGYMIETLVALILVGVGIAISSDASLRDEMTTVLAVYGMAIVRLVPVLNQLSGTLNAIHGAVPAIQNIHRTQTGIAILAGPTLESEDLDDNWENISLVELSYCYPNADRPALDSIQLVFARGERIGLVGHSGSGKTTLVDILSGLLFPTHGQILIGTENITRANASAWRNQIGYVSQHPFIADDSLRFNVTLETDPSKVDVSRVIDSLEAANMGDFIRTDLPEGLDTQLGERGIRFSGGQRQRVAIARALYRRPRLLILDEATSALDAESENCVSTSISSISRTTTMLIVAHRLSTVRRCDRIVVLDSGRVIGFDTHDNLIQTCPSYERLVELGNLTTRNEPFASEPTLP